MKSQAIIRSQGSREIGVGIILSAAVLMLYRKTLQYPFIEDDWLILHSIGIKDPVKFLHGILFPTLGSFYRPLGLAVVGGLFLSTFLTLTIVPTVYTLLARLSKERAHVEVKAEEKIEHAEGVLVTEQRPMTDDLERVVGI